MGRIKLLWQGVNKKELNYGLVLKCVITCCRGDDGVQAKAEVMGVVEGRSGSGGGCEG